MKKNLFTISFLLLTAFTFGQVTCGFIATPENYRFDGDTSQSDNFLLIDTQSNPNNTWQTGTPHKAIINSAYSLFAAR